MLVDLAETLRRRDAIVYFTNTQGLPIVHEQTAAHLADGGDVETLFRFHSTDAALECCEDVLLEGIQASSHTFHRNLQDYEITAGFTEDELTHFAKLLTYRTHVSGDRLITNGEEATNLLLITRGVVGVSLAMKLRKANQDMSMLSGVRA